VNPVWTGPARSDFRSQIAYVHERNPAAAGGLAQAVRRRIAGLLDNPGLGRPGRVAGTREAPVTGTRLVVVYRVEGKTLLPVRVLHTAQNYP
jgi:plasmid stabilization system protein ParE